MMLQYISVSNYYGVHLKFTVILQVYFNKIKNLYVKNVSQINNKGKSKRFICILFGEAWCFI